MLGDITQLLREWSGGDSSAADRLIPLVYTELRRLADSYMRRERSAHTLQPTALIHDAYLRLVQQNQPEWQSRSHFFRFAAHLMRQVLVDHARSAKAAKRGGQLQFIPVEGMDVSSQEDLVELLSVDEALNKLASFDERKARILEFKFFGGMTDQEVADALDTSLRTVERELRLAKAWMSETLAGQSDSHNT